MSFLKIPDPTKRDFLVQEYLKTRDKVPNKYITERTGELVAQRELTKLFKPAIKMQKTIAKDLAKEITESVTSALQPITEGVQKAIELAKYPYIQAAETDQDIDTSMVILGRVAENYLRQFTSKEDVDKTFGLYDKHSEFFITDSPIKIEGDDIIVKDKEYQRTPGL